MYLTFTLLKSNLNRQVRKFLNKSKYLYIDNQIANLAHYISYPVI